MNRKSPTGYFDRHLLRAGLECPAKLYYKAHNYSEDDEIKPFLEHAGFNKHHLKKLARQHYPEALLIKGSSREEAAGKTSQYLESDHVVLLEAAFIAERCYTKVPILEKKGPRIKLFDVRTKVFNPHKHRLVNHHGSVYKKWKPYIVDLAYKQWVIQSRYSHWKYKTFLLLPDKTQEASSDRLLQRLQSGGSGMQEKELFCRLDVSRLVDDLLTGKILDEPFEEILTTLKKHFFKADWQKPTVGIKCKNCEFRISSSQLHEGKQSGFHNCWSKSDEVPHYNENKPVVLDLIGHGVNDFIARGIYLQKNIPLRQYPAYDSVHAPTRSISQSQRQMLQVRKSKGKSVPKEIVKEPIFKEINSWEYPLHFLDFEAGNYAVPVRRNRKPYHLLVFQFSCHTVYADGSRTHHQWIDQGKGDYSNYKLLRRLMKIPKIERGTIVQYSNFERYVLKIIRKELTHEREGIEDADFLISWLDTMLRRGDSNTGKPPYLADMSRLVKNYYYNRYMESSLSIKDVIQSILTVSETLRGRYSRPYNSKNFEDIVWWQWAEQAECARNPYDILKSVQNGTAIGRGTEAMVVYGKILTNQITERRKNNALYSLLKYCELDTLAMLMIWEHWQALAQTD